VQCYVSLFLPVIQISLNTWCDWEVINSMKHLWKRSLIQTSLPIKMYRFTPTLLHVSSILNLSTLGWFELSKFQP
jgi:hypothetical protein